MSGRTHHDDDLDHTPEPDSFEDEGIQAFNRLTTAVTGLQSRLADLELGLGRKASQAERAAARAEEAAQAARTAAEHARGVAHVKARSAASWAVLGALAGILVAGGAGYWQRARRRTRNRPGRRLQGRRGRQRCRELGQHSQRPDRPCPRSRRFPQPGHALHRTGLEGGKHRGPSLLHGLPRPGRQNLRLGLALATWAKNQGPRTLGGLRPGPWWK